MTPEPRDLVRGLDPRERAVVVAIYEHKVLLTEHLKAMFFGSLCRAQDRLRNLAQRGLIDTWYPPRPRGMGKAAGHHTLTESGAHVVASLLGIARSELVYRVKRALYERPEFRLERNFEHIIVDEYQDLNRCELEVVRALTEDGAHLYVAGDDDQSIYGFRHAFTQGIREFINAFRGATDEELEVCHRCDRDILRLALSVAALDPRRVAKNLHSASDDDGTVVVLGFKRGAAEAKGVARICKYLIDVEGVVPGEILILQRRDFGAAFSTPLIEHLDRLDIPAQRYVNPFAVLDEESGRQVVCVLRLLSNRDDSLAWRQMMKSPSSGHSYAVSHERSRASPSRGKPLRLAARPVSPGVNHMAVI
jgi:superfamily I DNA/RNA helicase